MMVFPPWDLSSSQTSLEKALSSSLPGRVSAWQGVCLAEVSGGPSPGSNYSPIPRGQEGFFLQPLEMQRISFWFRGFSATLALAPPAESAQALG